MLSPVLLASFSGVARAQPAAEGPQKTAAELPPFLPAPNGATYDLGTLKNVGIENLDVCSTPYTPDFTTETGHPIKMLGVAFVYMGPSNGQSILGHAAERFVYCRDQLIQDVVFEYSEPDPLMMHLDSDFESEYGIRLGDYTDEYKAALLKSLYVTRSNNPASYYHLEQMIISRTIYETWMNVDGATGYQMLAASARAYAEQKRRIVSHEALEPYQIFNANCATPVRDNLQIANPAFLAKHGVTGIITPGMIYRRVRSAPVRKTIIYPSQNLLRLVRLKAAGKSRIFEGFVPLSKSLHGAFPGSWTLLFENGTSPWRKFLITPVYGAVNLTVGAAETIYGLLTTPLGLIESAKRKRELRERAEEIASASDGGSGDVVPEGLPVRPAKFGIGRMRMGLGDVFKSLSEVFTLKMRYPVSGEWTDEELAFFRDLQQNSALLEYLKAEWEHAPVLVVGREEENLSYPASESK